VPVNVTVAELLTPDAVADTFMVALSTVPTTSLVPGLYLTLIEQVAPAAKVPEQPEVRRKSIKFPLGGFAAENETLRLTVGFPTGFVTVATTCVLPVKDALLTLPKDNETEVRTIGAPPLEPEAPVPVTVNVKVGCDRSDVLIVMVMLRVPAVVGLKLTEIVQEAPAAIEDWPVQPS
jgi:hypothetical protein